MSWIPLLVILNIIGGLALEAYGASAGLAWMEPLVSLLTALHLGVYFVRPPRLGDGPLSRRMLLTCLALATIGELILSALWGLYHYRQSVLPLFVPPGHVLLFLCGLTLAEQIEMNHQRIRRWLWVLPAGTAVFIAVSVWRGQDALSVGLLAIFAVSVGVGPHRSLYRIMFVLALLMELLGTDLGAWQWTPVVPGLGISSANPPLAAGAFYAVLDLLTMALCGRTQITEPILIVGKPEVEGLASEASGVDAHEKLG